MDAAQTVPPRVLTEPEAARYLSVSIYTLRAWRTGKRSPGGTPPRVIRLGRSVRYDIRDLDFFLSMRD